MAGFRLSDWQARPKGRTLSLSVRNQTALIANLRSFDREYQRDVRRVVRDTLAEFHDAVFDACPKDTWFMAEHIRARLSEQGLAMELGWDALDFTRATPPREFYPPFVIFGTRYIAANDFFFPLRDRFWQLLRERVLAVQRQSVRRFNARAR